MWGPGTLACNPITRGLSQISFVVTLLARKYLNFFVAIIRIFLCFCQEKKLVKGKDKTMGKELKLVEAASIACRGLEGERIQWRFVLLWQGVRGAYVPSPRC